MNKYAVWYWDGIGPLPEKFGYKTLNMVSESQDYDLDAHALRVATMADGLESGEHLVINVEHYGRSNVVHAIRLIHAARVANPSIFIGVYVTQANGDPWGLCGKLPTPKDNALAISVTNEALEQLAPWVDFWCVDLYTGETTEGQPIRFFDRANPATLDIDQDATWEVIAATRVAMLERFNKPWMGFMAVTAISGTPKARATTIDKNRLYARAAWCRNKGADSIAVLVWDDARKKSAGTGAVANTPDIQQALNAIGKL